MPESQTDTFDVDLQRRYEAYLRDGTLRRNPEKRAMAADMMKRGIIKAVTKATPSHVPPAEREKPSLPLTLPDNATTVGPVTEAQIQNLPKPSPKTRPAIDVSPGQVARPTIAPTVREDTFTPLAPQKGMGTTPRATTPLPSVTPPIRSLKPKPPTKAEILADEQKRIADYMATVPNGGMVEKKGVLSRFLDAFRAAQGVQPGEQPRLSYPAFESPTAQQIYSAGRNAVQGAITPGLERSAQSPGSENPIVNAGQTLGEIFNPAYLGDAARSAAEAVANDSGPAMIGEAVPSLKPGTVGADVLNTATGAALNPLNFTPSGAMLAPVPSLRGIVTSLAYRRAVGKIDARLAAGERPVFDADGNLTGWQPAGVPPENAGQSPTIRTVGRTERQARYGPANETGSPTVMDTSPRALPAPSLALPAPESVTTPEQAIDQIIATATADLTKPRRFSETTEKVVTAPPSPAPTLPAGGASRARAYATSLPVPEARSMAMAHLDWLNAGSPPGGQPDPATWGLRPEAGTRIARRVEAFHLGGSPRNGQAEQPLTTAAPTEVNPVQAPSDTITTRQEASSGTGTQQSGVSAQNNAVDTRTNEAGTGDRGSALPAGAGVPETTSTGRGPLGAGNRGANETVLPERGALTPSSSPLVEMMNPDDLQVMPGMQFKRELADTKNNVTDQLKGQTNYNTFDGGVLTVWEDASGNRFAVDGHHRRELAQRAERFVRPGPNGAMIEAPRQIQVQVLREADGWTPEMAKAYGVTRNLKEGKGRAIDAADALTTSGTVEAARAEVGKLPKSALTRDTAGLVELSPDGRSLVRNGKVTEPVAAGVGKALPGDPERQQLALSQAVGRRDLSTFEDGQALGREIAAEDLVKPDSRQLGFDGMDVPQVRSTAAERAIIKQDTLKALTEEIRKAKTGMGLDLLPGESIDAAARQKIATELGETRGAATEKIGAAFSFDPTVQEIVRTAASQMAAGTLTRPVAVAQVTEAVKTSARRPIAQIVAGTPSAGRVSPPVPPAGTTPSVPPPSVQVHQTMIVGSDTVPLTPHQSAQFEKAISLYQQKKNSVARMSGGDRKAIEKQTKGLAMQLAAVKRVIVGKGAKGDLDTLHRAGFGEVLTVPDPATEDGQQAMFARRSEESEPTTRQAARETRIKFTANGPVLYLGKSDARLMGQVMKDRGWSEVTLSAPKVSQQLQRLKDLIASRKKAGYSTDALTQLHDYLSYATSGGVDDAVLIDASQPAAKVKADRLEGTGHRAVRRLITPTIVEAATTSPVWAKVSQSLDEIGYKGKSDALKAEEALVKIKAGKHSELGLTKQEAINLFVLLHKAGFAEHGEAWTLASETGLKEFRNVRNETTGDRGIVVRSDDAGRTGVSGPQRGADSGSLSDGRGEGITGDAGSAPARRPGNNRRQYLSPTARKRLARLGQELTDAGTDLAALPQNIQFGLYTWATQNSLLAGAVAARIAPDVLQNELVTRGVTPPGKGEKTGRAFALWVQNVHPVLPADGALWAESPYEAVRLAALNIDPFVESVSRAEKFTVRDPKTRELFTYEPDFRIVYKDGRIAFEEIKGQALVDSSALVKRKEQAARVYLAEINRVAGSKVQYRIISEATLGPAVFQAAKDSTSLKQYIPNPEDRATLDQRLKRAIGDARRNQAKTADEDTRFSRKAETPEERFLRLQENAGSLYRAGLLSNPATSARNVLSNAAFAATEEAAHYPAVLTDAARVSLALALEEKGKSTAAQTLGTQRTLTGINPIENSVFVGRAMKAVFKASEQGAKSGLQEAIELLKTGKVDGDRFSVGEAQERMGVDREFVSRHPLLDGYVNTIMRALSAQDRLFKTYAFTRSLEQQAATRARIEANQKRKVGETVAPEWITERTDALRKQPTDLMITQAISDAETATFNESNLAQIAVSGARRALTADTLPPPARMAGNAAVATSHLFLPFVRTPVNVLGRLLEYSLGGITAPVEAGLRMAATPHLKRNLEAAQANVDVARDAERQAKAAKPALIGHDPDGKPIYSKETKHAETKAAREEREKAERDAKKAAEKLAAFAFDEQAQRRFARTMGRFTVGQGLMAMGYTLAAAGVVTGLNLGQSDRKERDKNETQEASIKVGDKWMKISFLVPVGTMIVLGATLYEKSKWTQGGVPQTATVLGAGIGRSVGDAPIISEMSELDFLKEGDLKAGQRYLTNKTASFVPSGVKVAATLIDGKKRTPTNPVEGVAAGIPFLRSTVPAGKGAASNPLDPTRAIDAKTEAHPSRFSGNLLKNEIVENSLRSQYGTRYNQLSADTLADLRREERRRLDGLSSDDLARMVVAQRRAKTKGDPTGIFGLMVGTGKR